MIDDLATWIAPLSVEHFHRDHWCQRPLVSHAADAPERLGALEPLLGSFELPALLDLAAGEIAVWYERDRVLQTTTKVPPATARALHEAGLTLYFHLDPTRLGAGTLLARLCAQLGQTTSALAIHSVFATRRGNRTLAHIDERENFTIQLTGHKRWRVGHNPLWRVPLADWDPAMRAGDLLPPDAETFDLRPGSMLYVPGTWVHETEDLADSISFNVSIRAQSWADVLMPLVRQYLVVNHGWGDPAGRLVSDDGVADDVIEALAERVEALAHVDLPALSLFAPEPDAESVPLYRRNPLILATLRLRPGGFVVHIETPASPSAELPVPDSHLAVFRWVARRDRPFSFDDVRADVGVPEPIVRRALAVMLETELVVTVQTG